MPEIKTLITTWVCNWCGRGRAHVHGTRTPELADEYFGTVGWVATTGDLVACDRCAVLPDVAAVIQAGRA